MFPTLGHLINYIFGTDVNFPLPTYGFMLVAAFSTAGIVLYYGLKRKEKLGFMSTHKSKVLVSGPINYSDILISAFFYFVIGFKFVGVALNYSEFTEDINSYIFSLKGSFWGGFIAFSISAVKSYLYSKKRESKEAVFEEVDLFPHQITMNIVMVAMLSGIIGAKLFDIFENFGRFIESPIEQIFSTGGFTFYGGLIVGTISVWYYIRKRNINALHLIDAAAPAILAAYAVGRMACMLSGDGCWGVPNIEPQPEWLAFLPDWMWAYDFPHNVINEGVLLKDCSGNYCHVLEQAVFPTPLYESLLSLLFVGIIVSVQNKVKIAGAMFFLAIAFNGLARFFIEKIRVNNVYEIGSSQITQAEIISVLLIVIGIAGIIILKKTQKK